MCVGNHSVFYHDDTFHCTRNKHCQWGWFFYIASELLPGTVFFLIVIMLDITFTSGGVNGFIFYLQVLEHLILYGRGVIIAFGNTHSRVLYGLYFMARIFNLSFFSLKEFSFCLMKNATALDMIAFNYFTLLYCLLLVLVTIAVMNRFAIKLNVHFGLDKSQLSKSIIHGLSSFLVLCYFRTRVSLQLLSYADVCGSHRVFFNGKLKYMRKEHLQYAVPAVCLLIIVTFIPPILLFCYPLCYKILAIFHLEESKLMKILCIYIPLEKYKPLFDSFQSCFKDEHRYFAALYFIYRFLILLIGMLHKKLRTFYIILEVTLLVMFTIHACIGPYKNKWHNLIDTLLFSFATLTKHHYTA